MKQYFGKKLIYFVIFNIFLSGIITFLITNFTSDRNVKVLVLKINQEGKEFDYLSSNENTISTTYEQPSTFISRIDVELRNNKSIFEKPNKCLNLGKIRGTLPISISQYETTFKIEIMSKNMNLVSDCSQYVITLVELYNKSVQNRFKENYLFQKEQRVVDSTTVNKVYDEILKNLEPRVIENQRLIIENFLNKKQNKNSGTISEENLISDLMLNSYILSTFYNHNAKINQDKEKQNIYFKVVENLKLVTLKSETSFIVKPPSKLKIYIASFFIVLFLYILFVNFSLKLNGNILRNLFKN